MILIITYNKTFLQIHSFVWLQTKEQEKWEGDRAKISVLTILNIFDKWKWNLELYSICFDPFKLKSFPQLI